MKILVAILFSFIIVSNNEKFEKIPPPMEKSEHTYKTDADTIYILDKKMVDVDEWLKNSDKITINRIVTKNDKRTIIVIIGETEQ